MRTEHDFTRNPAGIFSYQPIAMSQLQDDAVAPEANYAHQTKISLCIGPISSHYKRGLRTYV